MDIAQYGLMDGERFAFIDTGNGLIFARDAYKSIETADSLEECESYIESMIK
jgi:hypothetical protein